MQNRSRIAQKRRAVDQAPEQSCFDLESGLASRHLFRSRIDRQWEQCAKSNQPLAVLLLALDGFPRGDLETTTPALLTCLRAVGEIIADRCRRRADFAGRMRQREIGIMLAEADADGARQVSDDILDGVRGLNLPHPLMPDSRLTISVGGAVRIPSRSRFASSLLISADHALTESHAAGGDQLVFFED